MNNFTISQLAQFSGIKAHTIRMWEQRHNALLPDRTEGNTRYYDNQQLRRLLNLVSLQETGRRISELSALSDEELFDLLKQQLSQGGETVAPNQIYYISQLLAAGMSYDHHNLEKMLAHCLLRFGMKATYTEIVYPMLQRIGLLWATDELPPGQEHFISHFLRQKLYTAIDSLPAAPKEASSWLLFLPENEFHEMGLLMAEYLLKLAGQRTLYLGANLPLSSVAAAGEDWPADNLLLFLVHRDTPENVEQYLQQLRQYFPMSRLLLSASLGILEQVKLPLHAHWLQSLTDLEKLLEDETIQII